MIQNVASTAQNQNAVDISVANDTAITACLPYGLDSVDPSLIVDARLALALGLRVVAGVWGVMGPSTLCVRRPRPKLFRVSSAMTCDTNTTHKDQARGTANATKCLER